MIKWIFKWLFRLFLLAIVLTVIFLLSLNSILRVIIEHNIRSQTGMQAEIGEFKLGLLEPQITIRDLKLFNTPEFGGTLFLNIPEIHAEYDPYALRAGQIHVTLLRFNLGELDIVKNEAGHTNIFSMGAGLPPLQKNGGHGTGPAIDFKKQTNLDFKSIDVLNVSIGTANYIDLKDPKQNRSQKIGIDNLVIKNVKSFGDLSGLSLILALRSGDFFSSLIDPKAAQGMLH
jgi:hypothetical protein